MGSPDRSVSHFGETTFHRRHVRFGIEQTDRLSHLYVIGKTGVGKSTLLEALAIGDLAERDVQVPADANLPLIAAALGRPGGGCGEVRELPGLNHLFQTSETGLPRDYRGIAETMSPLALEAIGDWILSAAAQGCQARP